MNDNEFLDRPVIAIYPNVRGFGFAVFLDKNTSKFCGVCNIKIGDMDGLLKKVNRLVETYLPSILILPKAFGKFNKKRERIQAILAQINMYADEKNLKFYTYSREDIRLVFEQKNAKSKHQIANAICEVMPEFSDTCPKINSSWLPENYYQGMYDAISLVFTHYYMTE